MTTEQARENVKAICDKYSLTQNSFITVDGMNGYFPMINELTKLVLSAQSEDTPHE